MTDRFCSLTRRAAVASALAAAWAGLLAPRLALASEDSVAAELKKLMAGRPATEGRIKLDVPQIAENGFVVPLNIEVVSPMTEADHVVALHVFADANPQPHVLTYHFTPMSGRAAASTRIRLAQTENIIALAEMSDGSLFTARATVKVTVGGCGG